MNSLRKRLIFLNMLVDTVGWSLLIPTLPGLYNNFHLNNVTIGAISSFLSLLVFICGTVQGKASDFFGRTRMLQVSAVSQLAGHILIIVAVRINSVPLFILARCFPSLLKCGMVVSQAFLYDISSADDISRDIGTLLASSNMAFIIGPVLGGYAYSVHADLPFYLGVALAIISILILLKLDSLMRESSSTMEEALSPRTKKYTTLVAKGLVPADRAEDTTSFLHYLHMKFSYQIGNSLYESLFAQHVKNQLGMTGSQIGLLLGFTGVLSVFTNGFLLKIILAAAKFPERYVWVFVIGLGCGLVGWALSSSLQTLVPSVMLITVCSNLFLSIMQSVIAQAQKYAEVRGKMRVRMYSSWREDKVFELGNSVPNVESNPQIQQQNEQTTFAQPQSIESVVTVDVQDDMTTGDEDDSTDCESDEMNFEDIQRPRVRFSPTSTPQMRPSRRQTTAEDKKQQQNVNNSPKSGSPIGGRSVGAVFGMSSAADRAARILSPLLGGLLLEQYGNMGLAYMSIGAASYCLALVLTCMPDRTAHYETLLREEGKLNLKKTN